MYHIFSSAERPFKNFAPLLEKNFSPFPRFFFGQSQVCLSVTEVVGSTLPVTGEKATYKVQVSQFVECQNAYMNYHINKHTIHHNFLF